MHGKTEKLLHIRGDKEITRRNQHGVLAGILKQKKDISGKVKFK